MKCDNCPALRTDGYEFPEYYCAAGVPEDSKMYTYDGCRYPLKVIRRRIERRDKMQSHQYDGITEFFREQEKHEDAMQTALNDALKTWGMQLCIEGSEKFFPCGGDGRLRGVPREFSEEVRTSYETEEAKIQKSYCDRCRWRDRYQKCTSCRRNMGRRDLFEEKKEAQE